MKQTISKKYIYISLIMIVVLVILFFVVSSLKKRPQGNNETTTDFKASYKKDDYGAVSVYNSSKDKSTIYLNGEELDQAKGELQVSINRNKTACFIHTKMEMHTDKYEDSVYYIKDGKLIEIGDDMLLVSMATHSKEALVMDDEGYLYLFDGSDIQKISEKGVYYGCISGDGKTISYTLDGKSYFGEDYENLKSAENVMIISISQDGKCIYGVKDNSKKDYPDIEIYYDMFMSTSPYDKNYFSSEELIYIDDRGNVKTICEDMLGITTLNSNGIEIMYRTTDGTYVCINKSKVIKISDEHITNVFQEDTYIDCKWLGSYGPFETIKGMLCETAPFEEDNALKSQKYICIFNDEYKLEVLESNSYRMKDISVEKEKMYYWDMDKNVCEYSLDNKEKKVLFADARNYSVGCFFSDDGELVYATKGNDYSEDERPVQSPVYYYNDNAFEYLETFSELKAVLPYQDGFIFICRAKTYYVQGAEIEEVLNFNKVLSVYRDENKQYIYVLDEEEMYIIHEFEKIKVE